MMTEEQKQAFSNLRKTLVACNRLNYCESAIAELEVALTQATSPDLKLPEQRQEEHDPYDMQDRIRLAMGNAECRGWNSCIAETKRLNGVK